MANVFKLKRRKSGNSGAPSSLKEGELAFNEVDQILYYGSGNDGSGNASNILTIAGGFTSLFKGISAQTINTTTTASNDYLLLDVNGKVRAIRLYDF